MKYLDEIIKFLEDVDCEIYKIAAPNNAALPYCIIKNTSSQELSNRTTLGARSATQMNAQIMVNAENLDECSDIAEAIKLKCDGICSMGSLEALRADPPIFSDFHNMDEFDGIYQASVSLYYVI